ncbi:response regulator [Paenibacillus sp. N3.4]|uniref:response regulator n=1 Tax=Paenibacillus sp. N3.4 TaxID=2603222 RepID=UPI0011CB6C8C|nr:response regulator [Paenibacillus sp. N3.4]TXK74133.1 response regulator [Paenibacillus sp. N3.4]
MNEIDLKQGKVLIVDDQELNISLLERILMKAGFHNLHSTKNPLDIERLLPEFNPDVILLDLHMPQMDGYEHFNYSQPNGSEISICLVHCSYRRCNAGSKTACFASRSK